MPLTAKGEKIKSNMEAEYGKEKGERVFYASKNAGKISGVDSINPEVKHEGNMDKLLKATDGVGKLVERFDSFLVRRRAGFKTRHDAFSSAEYLRKQQEELKYLEEEGEGKSERAEELRRRIKEKKSQSPSMSGKR